MQDSFRKILILFLLVASSCKQEKKTVISIYPIQITINGKISKLQEELKSKNIILTYENSYEGEAKGIKYFYFDDEADSLNYHFDIYTINDEIKSVEAGVFAKKLDNAKVVSLVENRILPQFKKSVINLENAKSNSEWINEKDSSGYYNFVVTTKELQEKH